MNRHPFLLSFLAIAFGALSPWATAGDWFVSPDGTADGGGTRDHPWDLQTALSHPESVTPGDTIWLMKGLYRHPNRQSGSLGYSIALQGDPNAPITVRNQEGKRVTIDGGLHTSADPVPRHLRVWGLEVIAGENLKEGPVRKTTQPGSHPDRGRPVGGITLKSGRDIKVINCVIHAGSYGVGFWRHVDGESELCGNIIHDNGWIGPDRAHGHGIYTQNASGDDKIIRDNLIFDNYARSVQAYGSGATKVEDYVLTGNYFGGRTPKGDHRVIFGGTSPDCGNCRALFSENLFYESSLALGYNCPAHDIELRDTTFIRGSWVAYRGSTGVETRNVTLWRREHPNRPAPEDIVFLRPNRYEPNRANLVLIQPSRKAESIEVDLSSFIKPGERFRLFDARRFFGEPVFEAKYSGEPTVIPVEGQESSAFVIFADRRP